MIGLATELDQILSGTPLEGAETTALSIPQHTEDALAVKVEGQNAVDAWRVCREKLSETGRWPLIVVGWSGAMAAREWKDALPDEGFFLRNAYAQESVSGRRDVSPVGLIAAAKRVDVDASLVRQAGRSLAGRTLEQAIEDAVESLYDTHRRAPDASDLQKRRESGEIDSLAVLQRVLLEWEASNIKPPRFRVLAADRYLLGFEVLEYMPPALLLLPTSDSWESLAFCHFYGANSFGTEPSIALLQRWHEQFGAELVGHFGTVLNFSVSRPPGSLAEALPLAWEQETVAECTTILPGVSTLHHARVLVDRDRWCLHERP